VHPPFSSSNLFEQVFVAARLRWLISAILATWEVDIGRIWDQGPPGEIVCETHAPISKITTPKWTRGVAQAVECLLCKYEALNSIPIPPKKKKGKVFAAKHDGTGGLWISGAALASPV
jgi:hypothetical protein